MNIYKMLDYRIFVIVPLAMILFSLYNIQHLELGIEFTGGTLITGITDKNITVEMVQEKISHLGEAEISVYQTASGKQVEIQIKKSDAISNAEQEKAGILKQITQYQEYLLTGNTSLAEQEEKSIRENAQKFFDEVDYTPETSVENMSVTGISDNAVQAYQDYLKKFYKSWEDVLKEELGTNALSINTVTSSLSERFIDQARNVVIYSAIIAFIIVFIYFREIVPAVAVIIGALSDVIIAMGGMAFFGIPLTFPSFATLLMLIGFSLDTDMLLTIRTLKHRETEPKERVYSSMKTGLTMTMTAILSFGLLFLVASATRIVTYYEISTTALIGLVGDLFATWMLNAVIILWYVERKEKTNRAKQE